MIKKRGKKAQVTIFIIIGIMIVVLAVILYFFLPQIKTTLGLKEQSPSEFIQSCIEGEIEENIETLSLQGGSLDPEHYILYDGEKIEYLCYTGEYYETCVMQQPMLESHIKEEIKSSIENSVNKCFNDLKTSYQKQGYSVNLREGETSVELLPKRIVVKFDKQLTLTRGETENYNSISVVLNNNLYELVSITNSILNFEARYGDSETTTYMDYYHDLKVEKKKLSDGTTVYILTDRNNGNKFQFASRSVAWPPGYGTSSMLF